MAECFSESEVIKEKFIFASYKHEDKDIFLETVNFLLEQGVRIWYDTDLLCGDDWEEKVSRIVNHENCLGTIFFNSKASFGSDAVEIERNVVKKKIEYFKEKNQVFQIFPINIGQKTTIGLIKAMLEDFTFDEAAHNAKALGKKIQSVLELFDDKTTYIFADSGAEESYKKALFDSIYAKLPDVVTQAKLKLKNLKEHKKAKNVGSLLCLDFGFVPNRPTSIISGSRLKQGDKIVFFDNENYMIRNGAAYSVKPLEWICIYCEGDSVVLITRDIVEKHSGGQALNDWINNVFVPSSFTDSEKEKIIETGLLKESDIELAEDDSFLTASTLDGNEECKWWIEPKVAARLQKAVKENGQIRHNGYNCDLKLGVRPIIKLKIDDINSIFENNV